MEMMRVKRDRDGDDESEVRQRHSCLTVNGRNEVFECSTVER